MKTQTKIQNEFKSAREIALTNLSSEKINLGKRSYSDYLKESKNRFKDDNKDLRLLNAKHTIEEVHKFREENHVDLNFC